MTLAHQIRKIAEKEYISPAKALGKNEFTISVRELMNKAEQQGMSTVQRTPAFCAAVRTQSFLRENGVEITHEDGPASKKSTTLVIHYRVGRGAKPAVETPQERAFRLTEKLRGLMKEEIAAHGGAEGYLRWVRGEDEEAG